FIEKLEEIENNLLFCDFQELKPKFRELLERMGVIDDLFIDRLQVITSNITSEETAAKLMHKFSEELATAEKVGALEGILKIEKPKIFGRKDYYAKLSNILLNLIAKIGENKKDKPIPLRQLESHFRDDYPYIEATSKDLIKACEEMNNYGLLFLERDSQGLIWIRLTPPESKANIILEIAKKEGIVTLENLILETGWSQATIQEELNKFIKAGCVVVDSSYAQGTKYYFPGLYEKNDSNE
ncbi:MAG: hypothetical protein U9O98_07095, partial [Asgard group archaeon]|nr:hypothetical protein [Asgard group archaeon]